MTDTSNNKTEVIRKIINEDSQKPEINLIGPSVKYIMINSNYKDQGVKVKDNCDSKISNKVTISGSVNTNKKGTYKITYEVIDSYGNKSSTAHKLPINIPKIITITNDLTSFFNTKFISRHLIIIIT